MMFKTGSNVTVHQAEMTIHESTVVVEDVTDASNPKSVSVVGHEYDEDREFYIAKLGVETQPGRKYRISMDFTGKLLAGLRGFYRSTYKNEEGEDV